MGSFLSIFNEGTGALDLNDSISEDYQSVSAGLTSYFDQYDYESSNSAQFDINSSGSLDPAQRQLLRELDAQYHGGSSDGIVDKGEWQALTKMMERKEQDLGAANGMLADTLDKIGQTLLAVAKYFD